jgi:SAM-dependent methyltransferase
MTAYYAQRLSAERLARCYALAAPRMQRYLEQELMHLVDRIRPGDRVLELGCGYGRVTLRLAEAGADVVGIDLAEDSLALARRDAAAAGVGPRCAYLQMDATELRFDEASFDIVACVQNGIAAFRVDPQRLVAQAWRVLRPGGRLLLSTYTEAIWPERLAWFRAQADNGLVGPLDEDASRDGLIVCRDGFRSGRADVALFESLASPLGVEPMIEEVDASSLWCELRKPPLFQPHSPNHGTPRPDDPRRLET